MEQTDIFSQTFIHVMFEKLVSIIKKLILLNLLLIFVIILSFQNTFSISDKFEGSVIFYKVSYFETLSTMHCDSTTIPAKSCKSGVCNHFLHFSSSSCYEFTNISVIVSATNILGSSQPSDSVTVVISVENIDDGENN